MGCVQANSVLVLCGQQQVTRGMRTSCGPGQLALCDVSGAWGHIYEARDVWAGC